MTCCMRIVNLSIYSSKNNFELKMNFGSLDEHVPDLKSAKWKHHVGYYRISYKVITRETLGDVVVTGIYLCYEVAGSKIQCYYIHRDSQHWWRGYQ